MPVWSLAFGDRIASNFPGGIWLINLAPLRDSSLVEGMLLTALGLRIGEGGNAIDAVATLLQRSALLTFDNCAPSGCGGCIRAKFDAKLSRHPYYSYQARSHCEFQAKPFTAWTRWRYRRAMIGPMHYAVLERSRFMYGGLKPQIKPEWLVNKHCAVSQNIGDQHDKTTAQMPNLIFAVPDAYGSIHRQHRDQGV